MPTADFEGLRRILEDLRKMIVLMERIESLAFPDDGRTWIRLTAVTKSNFAFEKRYRKDHNHLVSWVQMRCLRHPRQILPMRKDRTHSFPVCQERSLHFQP